MTSSKVVTQNRIEPGFMVACVIGMIDTFPAAFEQAAKKITIKIAADVSKYS